MKQNIRLDKIIKYKGLSYKMIYALLIILILPFANLSDANAQSQINYTISKTHNAPTPVQSGQPFTYTITYSWSGGAPGTLYIVDNVPSNLDVISALPSSPVSNITGNQVTFTLSGLSLPSGSGTVQINARFKPGITCGGDRACNIAGITDDLESDKFEYSEETCVTAAEPTNKWQFKKELIAGCAIDDEVIFRISIINPSGSNIGGVNLNNVQLEDLLPNGAEILNVVGSYSNPTNTTSNGVSWIPITGGPVNMNVSAYTIWYTAYVKVKFPSTFFTNGQTVENIAKLTFNTACDQTPVTWRDTAEVELCQGINQGAAHKWLTLGLSFPSNPSWQPVFSPGCCGTYKLRYQNNGTLSQSNFVMEDDLPGEVDVNSIRTQVPAANTPVVLEVYTWSGGSCSSTPTTTFTYTTAGTHTENTLPANICKVKWMYSGNIAVNDVIYNSMDVCVRSTNFMTGATITPGQNIQNTLTASATGLTPIVINHNKVVDNTQPKIITTKLFIGDCNTACQVEPGGPYQPGDTVRFRMAVANIGNANANSVFLTDNLPSGLSYIGNETYFYGAFNWMTSIYNPPCCSLTTTVPSDIGGTITTPSVGDTSLVWGFPVLPSRCDGTVEYFIIDFDVVISLDPPAPAGQYPNTFDFAASNVTTQTSNTAYLTVNATAQLQALKEVREQGSSTGWSGSANVQQGGIAEYQLTLINTGNTPLGDICMLDIMPWIGDIKVLPPYTGRGSTFDLPYNPSYGSMSITPAGYTPTYNNIGLIPSQNPSRVNVCGGFCGVSDPSGAITGTFNSTAVNTFSYKINANSGITLAAGATLNAIVPAHVDGNTQIGEMACNSFAVQAKPQGIPNVCLSAESNNACVTVIEQQPCFEILDYSLDCLNKDEKGNWVYLLNFDIVNNSGQNGLVQITAGNGPVYNVMPNNILAGDTTNVTAHYIPNQAPGGDCFTVVLFAQNSDEKLCESTFCLEYDICEDPCPCPLEIKIDRNYASQGSGNQVYVNSLFNISTGINNIRATIVSAHVTQSCWFGGSTSYNSAASFTNANNWGPVTPMGLGSTEIEWSNLQCPPVNNFSPGFYLDVPNAPNWFCYQNVEICIRYEFTDCKCNDCDTTICYNFRRKKIPIIIWDDDVVFKPHKGGIEYGQPDNYKHDKLLEKEQEQYISLEMTSDEEGVLTIDNPVEDEYTYGITINSINIACSDDVLPVDISSNDGSWSEPIKSENGIMITGKINPGQSGSFNITYDNSQSLKKWVNTISIAYTLNDMPEELYGYVNIVSRTPGAVGGDIIANENPGMNVENARTFALRFENDNMTKDSIHKVVLKLSEGQILAVGPGLSDNEFILDGFKTPDSEVTLLAGKPNETSAIPGAIPAGSIIGPIYLTVASEDPKSVMLQYTTYSEHDDMITDSKVELTNPIMGISDSESGMINLVSSFVYPNPSSDEVNFKFTMNKDEYVTFSIRDLSGRTINTIYNNKLILTGEHSVTYSTKDIPSGTYYYTIEAGNESHTRKFVITK